MGDDPPFLSVGTEVSAKYKGAFCEAKVRKVVKSIKCKVIFKLGLGSAVVSDDQIKGVLRVGAQVEAKHPEKNTYCEGLISKIQDCSQYTVVFDDGDITTLRRTALCLKSGRHFAESETLDQLPLTHPEHFGTPVLGGRRGGRRRQDDSSDEEGDDGSETPSRQDRSAARREAEPDIGKIVCVEVSGEKKKGKEPWFPGLIVAPTAQDTVSIRVKDEYLVRSFKDGRYYTVPKKEAQEFTREVAAKTDSNTLRGAIEKAVAYLDRDELPAHWDREALFGLDDTSSINDESKAGSEAESSDEETREEKDHFVAQLYKFMDDRGTPINKGPTINSKDLDLYRLFNIVHKQGGFNRVTNQNGWKAVTQKMLLGNNNSTANLIKQAYKKYLLGFEEFYRKLGCTMNSPRGPKSRSRPGRSLIRDRDRAQSGSSTPKRDPEVAEEDDNKEKASEAQPEKEAPKAEKAEKSEKSDKLEKVEKADKSEKAEKVEKIDKEEVKEEAKVETESSRADEDEESEPSSTPVASRLGRHKKKVVKEEESDDNDGQENENSSQSSQSARSQRTRSRKVEEEPTPSETPRNRKRGKSGGKSSVEDKTSEEEDQQKSTKGGESEKKAKAKEKEKDKDKDKEKERENNKSKSRKSEGDAKPPNDKEEAKKNEEETPTPKRRGRKPRAQPESEEEDGGRLPSHVDVQIGDKLKVYYGPMQDSKVTYEAKVCEIRTEGSHKTYLVHYTGWNTRYDEWIKRVRIAENLTWTASRKRSKSTSGSQTRDSHTPRNSSSNSGSSSAKSGPPSKRGRTRGQDSSRSATPSSVTSTSSTGQRNASIANQGDDGGKSSASTASGSNSRRRSRRISEMSVGSDAASSADEEEVSDNDDDDDEETNHSSSRSGRKKPAKKPAETEEPTESLAEADASPQERTPRRRRRKKAEKKSSDAEESSTVEAKAESPVEEATVTTPVRRGRRRFAPAAAPEEPVPVSGANAAASPAPALLPPPAAATADKEKSDQNEEELTAEAETDLMKPSGDEHKGKDIDLKKIRSELKMPNDGPATAVSPPPPPPPATVVAPAAATPSAPAVSCAAPAPAAAASPSSSVVSPSSPSSVPSGAAPAEATPGGAPRPPRGLSGGDDDVYEFREPEPFEFEVRARRESPFNDDRVGRFVRKPKEDDEQAEAASAAGAPPAAPSPPKKANTTARSNSGERNKMVISPPPAPTSAGKARPCLSATVVPIAPSPPAAAPEASEPVRLASPVPLVVVEVPAASPQPPIVVPVALPAAVASPVASARILTPPPVQGSPASPSVIVAAPKSAEDASAATASSAQPVAIPSFLPHVMPALSALAARSVKSPASSKSSPTPPSVPVATKVESADPVKVCKEETPNPAAPTLAPVASPAARLSPVPATAPPSASEAESKAKIPVKRERRKANKKAISREFIESDEDSPEDASNEHVEEVTAAEASAHAEEESKEAPVLIKVEEPVVADPIDESMEAAQLHDPAKLEAEGESVCLLDESVPGVVKGRRSSAGSASRVAKIEEDLDENSLLCEETIPGSPVTHVGGHGGGGSGSSAAPCDLASDGQSSPLAALPSTSRSTEMPFASAPTASNNLPRTRGLGGSTSNGGSAGIQNHGGRPNQRKRGLREALAMQRPPIRCPSSGTGSAVVMDNTPPTTPEGSLSSSSNSPQADHGGLSPDHESSAKSEREFSENDADGGAASSSTTSVAVQPTRNIGPRASATVVAPAVQPPPPPPPSVQSLKRREEMSESSSRDDDQSPHKRRRRGDALHRRGASGGRGQHGRSPRRTGSDSEDAINSDFLASSVGSNCLNLSNFQPRSTRYNFCTDLDPELDASQRIAVLQEKLRELRQTYTTLKAQVVLIDRRKKKLKRKEKDGASS